MSDEEKHEWDRLPGESSKAYAHFCLYRDVGVNRSIRQMPSVSGCTSVVRQLNRWSSKWRWVERCQKYDDYLEHQDRLRQERERRQMRERHAKIAVLGQNIVVRELESLLAKAKDGGSQMTPSDVARLMDVAVKIERLSRGDATEIQKSEHTGSLDIEARYRAMSPEERRAEMVRILREELGKTEEESETLAGQIAEAKK